MKAKQKKMIAKPETCPNCGEAFAVEDGKTFKYVCPECDREGCDVCMPGGANCLCPECEEDIA